MHTKISSNLASPVLLHLKSFEQELRVYRWDQEWQKHVCSFNCWPMCHPPKGDISVILGYVVPIHFNRLCDQPYPSCFRCNFTLFSVRRTSRLANCSKVLIRVPFDLDSHWRWVWQQPFTILYNSNVPFLEEKGNPLISADIYPVSLRLWFSYFSQVST